jgi:hypothetical protein
LEGAECRIPAQDPFSSHQPLGANGWSAEPYENTWLLSLGWFGTISEKGDWWFIWENDSWKFKFPENWQLKIQILWKGTAENSNSVERDSWKFKFRAEIMVFDGFSMVLHSVKWFFHEKK